MNQTQKVLLEVEGERAQQDDKWGQQNHPDGTDVAFYTSYADCWRNATDYAARKDNLTWTHILGEEFTEALAEEDESKLRAELIQVAAVAVAWIEAIDRRSQ